MAGIAAPLRSARARRLSSACSRSGPRCASALHARARAGTHAPTAWHARGRGGAAAHGTALYERGAVLYATERFSAALAVRKTTTSSGRPGDHERARHGRPERNGGGAAGGCRRGRRRARSGASLLARTMASCGARSSASLIIDRGGGARARALGPCAGGRRAGRGARRALGWPRRLRRPVHPRRAADL